MEFCFTTLDLLQIHPGTRLLVVNFWLIRQQSSGGKKTQKNPHVYRNSCTEKYGNLGRGICYNTVKLVYKDHPRDQQNVVLVYRWPLHGGSIV